MRLLVVRHAIAEDREEFAKHGRPDDERPLTTDGRAKMKAVVEGLCVILKHIDIIGTSPLVRAEQTAEILSDGFGSVETVTVPALEPSSDLSSMLRFLRSTERLRVVALVGHEPHLGRMTSWLLTGRDHPFVSPKKGSAMLLEFEGSPREGTATLLWALTPAHLRALAQ
jgi:phosphohistidine phosphatase